MDTQTPSPRFKINYADLYKTIRGTILTYSAIGALAIIATVSQRYLDWSYIVCYENLPCFDLKVFAVPLIGGVLELARRFFTDLRNK